MLQIFVCEMLQRTGRTTVWMWEERKLSEMEISGFLNNSVVSGDVFLEAVFQEGMRCFPENRHFRRHVMFRKNINGTPKIVRGHSCTGILCHVSLVFTGLHLLERNCTKALPVVFWLILATSTDLCWFSGALLFLWIELLLLIHVWCLLLNWTAGILTTKSRTALRNYF